MSLAETPEINRSLIIALVAEWHLDDDKRLHKAELIETKYPPVTLKVISHGFWQTAYHKESNTIYWAIN